MNLRISENQLRFRITQGETELLMRDGLLTFSLHLGTEMATYAIALIEGGRALALEVQKNVWKLLVNRHAFSQLLASLPSREGIELDTMMNGAPIALVLEVDVRRKQKA